MTRPGLAKLLQGNSKNSKIVKKRQTCIGPTTKTCSECLMTYSFSESDIKLHKKHHANFKNRTACNLTENSYKILTQDSKSKIIKITQETATDTKKVKLNNFNLQIQEILSIVDDTLGSSLESCKDYQVFFLLIMLEVFLSDKF